MSTGKNKAKIKKKSRGKSNPLPMILAMVAGAVVVAGLVFGGNWVLQQRGIAKDYEASMSKIREQLQRDPDSAQGMLKLSEIPSLLAGNPTVTRETKDGSDYSIYRWGSAQQMGFRLKIEKDGGVEEVVELESLGNR